jgi:hypothetical protein
MSVDFSSWQTYAGGLLAVVLLIALLAILEWLDRRRGGGS